MVKGRVAAAVGAVVLGVAALAAQPTRPSTPSVILVPTKEPTERNALLRLASAPNGVSFDIDGDGRREQVSWTEPTADVGFLALDRNRNGIIDNGRELFGSHAVPGASNGFDALALARGSSPAATQTRAVPLAGIDVFVPDYNKSWVQIDHYDALFARLLLWTDRNHDGIFDRSEVVRVNGWLAEIGLNYDYDRRVDPFGNRYAFKGWANVRPALGKLRATASDKAETALGQLDIYDVFLVSAPSR